MKDIYKDGHERSDVVKYRGKFVEFMEFMKKGMEWNYSGEYMELVAESECEHEYEWIAHDESCMYANDGRVEIWHEKNRPPIRPKGQGQTIMISVFLSPKYGVVENTTIDPGYLDSIVCSNLLFRTKSRWLLDQC